MALSPFRWRSMGRCPITHPPGSATIAALRRARSGPRTHIEPRMSFTSSYGAVTLVVSTVPISNEPSSKCFTLRPRHSSMRPIISTSVSLGMDLMREAPFVNMQAAMTGRAAFFAPFTVMLPVRRQPPSITNFSSTRSSNYCTPYTLQVLNGLRVSEMTVFIYKFFNLVCLTFSQFHNEPALRPQPFVGACNYFPVAVQPVATRHQRPWVFVIPHLRLKTFPLILRHVGWIGYDEINLPLKPKSTEGLIDRTLMKGNLCPNIMSLGVKPRQPQGLGRYVGRIDYYFSSVLEAHGN